MTDRFVVCKSRGVRIPCDGPLTAEVARFKLIDELNVEWSAVEIEYVKKARPLARAEAGRKRSTKLRYK